MLGHIPAHHLCNQASVNQLPRAHQNDPRAGAPCRASDLRLMRACHASSDPPPPPGRRTKALAPRWLGAARRPHRRGQSPPEKRATARAPIGRLTRAHGRIRLSMLVSFRGLLTGRFAMGCIAESSPGNIISKTSPLRDNSRWRAGSRRPRRQVSQGTRDPSEHSPSSLHLLKQIRAK